MIIYINIFIRINTYVKHNKAHELGLQPRDSIQCSSMYKKCSKKRNDTVLKMVIEDSNLSAKEKALWESQQILEYLRAPSHPPVFSNHMSSEKKPVIKSYNQPWMMEFCCGPAWWGSCSISFHQKLKEHVRAPKFIKNKNDQWNHAGEMGP